MGKIGHGYGSEWHLLRHLGYHRNYLSEQILRLIGGQHLEWLDFGFSKVNAPLRRDRELDGLEFIDDPDVQRRWHAFWPQSGRAQNWDAVGKISLNGEEEWLLVEAKAHIHEARGGSCRASNPRSKEKIEKALEKTMAAFGATSKPLENWLGSYYQYANRLAVLHFLRKECKPSIPVHLLFIYFYGDKRKDADPPQTAAYWEPAIAAMEAHLGIDRRRALFRRVRHLFLPVNPKSI